MFLPVSEIRKALIEQPIGADAWFDAEGIGEYEVKERSIRLSDGTALVIVRITEEAMQEDYGRRNWSSGHRR